jgi:D-arabinose 1-dehydrogenase-like Zn-dependent alcohol dehydrogenase
MTIKSFWHVSKNKSELVSETIDMANLEELVITLFSAVSLGTEKLVSQGKIPDELHEKMKVPYMQGSFNFPVKYGYSIVGENSKNQLIQAMHPHQTHCFIDEKTCFVLSKKINPIVATQLSNMETVINAIWVSDVKPNQKVVVCGAGSIGILLAETLKNHCNAQVFIKESNEEKVDFLRENGFLFADEKDEFEICYNVSTHQEGLQFCIDHCVTEGKIIELSWYGDSPITLNLGSDFHYKRLQIISSQVSEIPMKKQKTEDFLSRKKLAESILNKLDILRYISIIPFDELPKLFHKKVTSNFITVVKY